MPQDVAFSIRLPADLAANLRQTATARGWTPESLIVDCVAQVLETTTRHRVLVERLGQVDDAILAIAQAVGELGGPSDTVDLSKICRYRPRASARDAGLDT